MSPGGFEGVSQRLIATADAHPSAVAIDEGERCFTYAELMTAARRAAARIEDYGIGDEEIVAVSAPPSFEAVAAILGILLSGRVYLPIDPAYPESHRRWIEAEADPALNVIAAPVDRARKVDVHAMLTGRLARTDELCPFHPQAAAYVIFTSGSTGKPKGVVNTHRGLANLSTSFADALHVSAGSRVAQLAPLSFDASIAEIFPTLAVGATLCIPPAEARRFGPDLAAFLDRYEVTHVTATPSAWATVPRAELPALQRIILAGEHPPESLVAKWLPSHEVFNAYGPTEAAVCATVNRLRPGATVTLGRPLDNVEVDVVGPDLRSLAEGQEGELVIGGKGVARGYVGRPGLTAQRFVPASPFRRAGERMYRTGDRVRRLADGELLFLGRLDRQAKVRGFRIEPGEVEERLLAHDGVRQAAVVLRPREGQIRAYLVCEPGTEVVDVREHAEGLLPAHAVPTQLIPLPAFPLSPSGKVDYARLEATGRPKPAAGDVAGGSVEDRLAALWEEILGLGEVDRERSVFEQGAHSLAVERAAARIRNSLGVSATSRVIFDTPSIIHLARRIEAGELPRVPSYQGTPEPMPDGKYSDEVSHQQRWMLGFLERVEAAPPFFRLEAAVALEGEVDLEPLEDAITSVVSAHDSFQLAFRKLGGSWRKSLEKPRLRLPRHQVAGRDEEAIVDLVRRRLAGDCATELDFGAPPLGRFRIFQLAERRYVITLACHHLVFDAWSFRLLFDSLNRVLRGDSPRGGSYEDFVRWQQRRIADGRHAADLQWWKGYLKGVGSAAREAPPGDTGSNYGPVAAVPVQLGGVSSSVRRLAVEQGTTPFAVLLAAYGVALAEGDCDDLVVAVPSAGRSEAAFDEIVGYFSNNLLLRLRPATGKRFVDLLEELQADLLDVGERGAVHWDEVSRQVTGTEELGRVKMGLYPAAETMLPQSSGGSRWSLLGTPVPRPERSDLHLILADEGALAGELAYRPEAVSSERAHELALRFESALERACAEPQVDLKRLREPLSIGTGGRN